MTLTQILASYIFISPQHYSRILDTDILIFTSSMNMTEIIMRSSPFKSPNSSQYQMCRRYPCGISCCSVQALGIDATTEELKNC